MGESEAREVKMPSWQLSDDGFREAKEQVRAFVSDLLQEASLVARRGDAEAASAAHVRRAAGHIYTNRRRRKNEVLTSVGGLLGGAGLSGAVGAGLAQPVVGWVVVLTVLGAIVGAVLTTWGLVAR